MKKNNFIKSLIQQANPLELLNEDGTSKCFSSNYYSYVHVMDEIARIASKGYVDIILILGELYDLTFRQAIDTYDHNLKESLPGRYFFMDYSQVACKSFFRKFIIGLHKRTRTSFDSEAFESAFADFVVKMKQSKTSIDNGKEKTTEGNKK